MRSQTADFFQQNAGCFAAAANYQAAAFDAVFYKRFRYRNAAAGDFLPSMSCFLCSL